MIELIIADDHAILRTGIKTIISSTGDIKITEEASSGEELLMKLLKKTYDLVILDLSMPGQGGLYTLGEIKHQNPEIPVLVLSVHPEEQIAERVIKAGAAGYLNKETAPDELIKAIRHILSGRKYISQRLAEKLAFNLEFGNESKPHESLSDREFQVLLNISKGLTLTEIANQLNLSVKTISTYRTRVLEKMKMKNNSELTYYAIENNLLTIK